MNDNKPRVSYQFKEGHYAFFRGKMNNLHHPESHRGKEWQRGFDRAYFENLDRCL
jgi:hypothetical protein